jgi:asparagine synthase (glutamine-hydrolysing)
VYSVTDPNGGRRSVDPFETARVCADQYDRHGREFVERLDGEFVGLLYNTDGTATFFVDRCGVRPLYHAVGDEGFAFSTNVQTVPELPGFAPAFDEQYLAEYIHAKRSFGTKTPVAGIEQIAPATLLTYEPDAETVEDRQYWEPVRRPVDRPVSYFVRELADRFERAVADRMPDSADDYGLLLSGGSDSRAVLAAADDPPKGYHMGDAWNREARAAKRSADAVGAEFAFLERGLDYHETLLERASPIMEFIGTFHTGHALGFAEEIDDEVDVLLTGLYSDTLLSAWSIPQLPLPNPFGLRLSVPVPDVPTTAEEYVSRQLDSRHLCQPPFLRTDSLETILRANVHERDGRIDHHGIEYPSVEQLALSEFYYPVTNGIGFDLYSTLQIVPTRNPFLDRRLIDLHLSIPLKHRLRCDLTSRMIQALSPSLAAVPHASTGVPLTYPKAAQIAGKHWTGLRGRLGRGSESYRTEGPWQNIHQVIREHDFVGRALEANEGRIRRLPMLDWAAVRDAYRAHRAGEANYGHELYRLLTVLEMPLTGRILDE